ncbi:hypothetical protein C8J57DRAFT_1380876 [Mycena rebaudengoi]|nr:hypothetical protein C8J57DRAFT_1733147 [Mycena rebaudengoi]KAJ7234232.1 hypothetical protein C8J57DRAFT_1380876 [Mycena rebaudengoi]
MAAHSHSESPIQLNLAHSWFEFVEKGDMDGLASILSDNLTHHLLPASTELPAPMESPFDKTRHLDVYRGMKRTMDFYNFHPPQEVIQTADSNTIVIHRTGNGVTKKGYAYHNEYIFIFKFEGGKIVSIKEFIDLKAFEAVVAAASRQ